FFFSSRRRHTRSKRDWSSDVCSSDLESFNNIALHFDIPEPSLIYSWYKLWQSKGIDGLSKPKGRPSMSKKPKKKTDKKLTKEQQLEKEIELLRAENAYLKKL